MRLRQLRLPALLLGILMLDATLDAPVRRRRQRALRETA